MLSAATYFLTPTILFLSQLGRRELYDGLPFQAVFGLQSRERTLSKSYASFVASQSTANLQALPGGADEEEKEVTNLLGLDSSIITLPLLTSILIAR